MESVGSTPIFLAVDFGKEVTQKLRLCQQDDTFVINNDEYIKIPIDLDLGTLHGHELKERLEQRDEK